jgi:hypothetical protein
MERIKMNVAIYIETEDGEEACSTMQSGLRSQLGEFPAGEVVGVDVNSYTHADADSIRRYFDE